MKEFMERKNFFS